MVVYEQGGEYFSNVQFREDKQYEHYAAVVTEYDEGADTEKVKKKLIEQCKKRGIKRVYNLFNDDFEKNCQQCRNLCEECDCYE